MSDEGNATYLYGIVLAGTKLPNGAEGIQGDALRVVELGRVAAVVSDLVELDMLNTPEALRNHITVLDGIAKSQPVLPLAFGTVIPWETEIASEILAPRETEYAAALERLSGLEQFTLRVSYERDSILQEILLADPEVAELRGMIIGTSEDETRTERIRLGEIVVKTMKKWRLSDAPPILDRIEPITADVSTRDGGQPEDVLEVAVLLRQDSLDEFDAIVEDLAKTNRERMRFRLMGPQAPYDFVPEM